MDQSKYFVTALASTLTSKDTKRQARKMKRERQKEEVKNQATAKALAEKKRSQWIQTTYFEIIQASKEGTPWSVERYEKHVKEIESPFLVTIGNYRVATGGINKTACFKTLAGELISGAIGGEQEKSHDEGKKRRKNIETRTENTMFGSDVLSAERRLTKRTKKDQYEQMKNKKKMLTKNIQMGQEVLLYISNLKKAEETLTRSNVTIEHEYWMINETVTQEKMRNFLKLWFFPQGGGKLSQRKNEQMDALRKFNLTKDGIEFRIQECMTQLTEWKKEVEQINM